MKWILYPVILAALITSGCDETEVANDDTFKLDVSFHGGYSGVNRSGVNIKGKDLHIDLFTEGERTISVDRGEDGHTLVKTASSRIDGSIPRTAQIFLTAKLKLQGEATIFEKEAEIRTNSTRGGGPSSGTVDPDIKLSDLVSFIIESGEYTYGKEILLGTVEGERWTLTVK